MDANTPEFIVSTAPGVNANSTGVKLIVPLVESLTVVEFGVYNDGGADIGTSAVLKLQGVDTTANGGTFTDLLVATTTAAAVRGSTTARRCDVGVEKQATVLNTSSLTNRAVANGTQILPSAGKQFIAIQLNLTTGGAMSSTGVFYLKLRKQGSCGLAISGETLVTS